MLRTICSLLVGTTAENAKEYKHDKLSKTYCVNKRIMMTRQNKIIASLKRRTDVERVIANLKGRTDVGRIICKFERKDRCRKNYCKDIFFYVPCARKDVSLNNDLEGIHHRSNII